MPLVTITTTDLWSTRPLTKSRELRAIFLKELGMALPVLLTTDPEEIGVGFGTPPEAVQVDYKMFSLYAINNPDIWIKIEFTEDPWSSDPEQSEIVKELLDGYRDEICGRIAHWVREHKLENQYPAITIDLFWGPGRGVMVGRDGKLIINW